MDPIRNRMIVFTGRISRPRHEFHALVEKHGGIPGSSVTRNTDYLIVGEKPGSKVAKAIALGIRMLTEEEFLTLLAPTSEEEIPLTKEELLDIEESLVSLTCAFCKRAYKQWAVGPPTTETCPVCSILTRPACPHCDDDPIYVLDYNLYHCSLCDTWFKAPYTPRARSTQHRCLFQKRAHDYECLACNNRVYISAEVLEYKRTRYEEAPSIVQNLRRQAESLRAESLRKEEAMHFLETLSPVQIQQLKEQLYAEVSAAQ